MSLRVRALTDSETIALRQLAHARKAPLRSVQRAQIVWRASQGQRAPVIAGELGVSAKMVRLWLRRFNEHGLTGLADAPRSGRPSTYPAEQVSELIAAVLAKPEALALPFANWTLDRLVAYLGEQKEIAMKRSRVDEILLAEGVRWRTQETWFGERVDPAFAKKRGPSCSSTRCHLTTASSSV